MDFSFPEDDLPLLAASLRSGCGGGGGGNLRQLVVDHDARAMEAATRAMEKEASRVGVAASMMMASMNGSLSSSVINMSSNDNNNPPPLPLRPPPPPHPSSCKRAGSFGDEDHFLSHIGLHGNRFKMANHSKSREVLIIDWLHLMSMVYLIINSSMQFLVMEMLTVYIPKSVAHSI